MRVSFEVDSNKALLLTAFYDIITDIIEDSEAAMAHCEYMIDILADAAPVIIEEKLAREDIKDESELCQGIWLLAHAYDDEMRAFRKKWKPKEEDE